MDWLWRQRRQRQQVELEPFLNIVISTHDNYNNHATNTIRPAFVDCLGLTESIEFKTRDWPFGR